MLDCSLYNVFISLFTLPVPREGVVYLILQGAVREVNKEPDRCKYTTKIVSGNSGTLFLVVHLFFY